MHLYSRANNLGTKKDGTPKSPMPGMIVAVFNKLAEPIKIAHNLDPSIFLVTLRRYLCNANSRIKLKSRPRPSKRRRLARTDEEEDESEAIIAEEAYRIT
jgi:hypothetical protein